MKKIAIFLMLLCITFGANAQLLWKISGKDLPKPSYILGTHHLAPISIVDSIANFEQTLHAVEQVYGEIVMEEMNNPTNIQKMQQAIVLPQDTTLRTLLSPTQYDRVAVEFKQLMGVDLKMMEQVKPAFLKTQIDVILAMRTIEGFNPQQQLDGWIQAEAKKQGKTIGSLETMDMQVEILFNSQTLQRQAELLYATVMHTDETIEIAKRMTKAYMEQNLEQLEATMNIELGNDCDALPEEKDRLLYDRNENWIKVMPTIMHDHPTLFVVGAGHLVGERGVLNLLKEQGYLVEPQK